MRNIWIFSEFFYVWLSYLCKSLRIISLVWPTRLIFLAMGEVLSFGFNLAVLDPSDKKGTDTYCIVAIEDKKMGFISYCMNLSLYIIILLKALLCFHELNTLDACWIAVDVWSNSSRCRQESVYLSRRWCLYTWSCLDILIINRFSINCSTVICSPTVILMLSWEKPLVNPMSPGSISHHTSFQSTLFCNLYFQSIS